MSDFLKTSLLVIASVVSITIGFGYAAYTAIMLPDVHYNYKTKDCVKVENYLPDDEYSCENLPKRFRHVWVMTEE